MTHFMNFVNGPVLSKCFIDELCIFSSLSLEEKMHLEKMSQPNHPCEHNVNNVSCEYLQDRLQFSPHTYEDYLVQRKWKRELDRSVFGADVNMKALQSLRKTCSVNQLAYLLFSPEEYKEIIPMSGLFFWNLVKKLYYLRYRRHLSRCTWRVAAHVFHTYDFNHRPTLAQDFVQCLWRTLHFNVELSNLWTSPRPVIFLQDETEIYVNSDGQPFHAEIWKSPNRSKPFIYTLTTIGHVKKKCREHMSCSLNEAHMDIPSNITYEDPSERLGYCLSSDCTGWKLLVDDIKLLDEPPKVNQFGEICSCGLYISYERIRRQYNLRAGTSTHVVKVVKDLTAQDAIDANVLDARNRVERVERKLKKMVSILEDIADVLLDLQEHTGAAEIVGSLEKFQNAVGNVENARAKVELSVASTQRTLDVVSDKIKRKEFNEAHMFRTAVLGTQASQVLDSTIKVNAEKVGTVVENLSVSSSRLDRITSTLDETVPKISAGASKLLDLWNVQSQRLFEGMSELKDHANSTLEKAEVASLMFSNLGSKLLMVCEAFTLYVTHRCLHPAAWYFLLGHTVVRWLGLDSYISQFGSYIHGLISQYFRYEASQALRMPLNEAQASFDGGAKVIAGTVLAAVGVLLFKKFPKGTTCEKFLKTIDTSFTVNRSLEHIPKLFEKITEIVKSAAEWFVKDDIPDHDLRETFEKYKERYGLWTELISRANTIESKLRIEYDDNYRTSVLKLRDEANVYMSLFSDKRWPTIFVRTFNKSYSTICELAQLAENAKRCRQYRYDPWCIWISGQVRAGKSYLCASVCTDLAEILDAPLENSVYARGSSDHWDRYVGQEVVYFDDFGQWKGEMGQERMNELIACRSNNMWITKQADISDKGRPFTSKAIVISSNFDYCDTTPVHLAEAVHSRRHLVYHVEVKKEYIDPATNLPDPYKVADRATEDKAITGEYQYDHLLFYRIPSLPGQNQVRGPPMTYSQFREEYRREFTKYHEYQSRGVKNYYEELYARVNERIEKRNGLNEAHALLQHNGWVDDMSDWSDELRNFVCELRGLSERDVFHADEAEYAIYTNYTIKEVNGVEILHDIPERFDFIDEKTLEYFWKLKELSPAAQVEFYNRVKRLFAKKFAPANIPITEKFDPTKGIVEKWEAWTTRIPSWRERVNELWQSAKGSRLMQGLAAAASILGAGALMFMLVKGYKKWSAQEESDGSDFLDQFDMAFDEAEEIYLSEMKCSLEPKIYSDFEPRFKKKVEELYTEMKALHVETGNEAEMAQSGDPRTSRPVRVNRVAARPKPSRMKLNTAHSASDPNAMAIVNNTLKRHLWIISRSDRGRTQALAFNGQNLLLPYHLVADLKDGELMTIENGEVTPIMFHLEMKNMVRIGSEDLVVIRDIARLPPGPKISKLCVREKDIAKYCGELEGGLLVNDGGAGYTFYMAKIRDITTVPVQDTHSAPTSSERFKVTKGWYHTAPLVRGMCLAPLVVFNSKLERKLIGVHISGVHKGKSGGVAILVTEEMLESFAGPSAFDDDLNEGHLKDLVVQEKYSHMIGPGYVTYGQCAKEWREFAPEGTTIKKTLIHGLVRAPTSEPAILSRFDPRNEKKISPVANALHKYEKRTIPFRADDRKQVKAEVNAIHIKTVLPLLSDIDTIDYELIVNGSPTESFYKALEMDSSPGIPWKKSRPPGVVGKRHLFTQRDDFTYVMKPDLEKEVTQALLELRAGKRPASLWVHVPKDERRPLAKIKAVKTRIFTMAPVHITLAVRALTMHFTAAYYKAHAEFYSTIGVDAHSPTWTYMLQRLHEVGLRGGDGDYGQYDGTLDPDLIMDAMEMIADWILYHSGSTYTVRTPSQEVRFSADEFKRALKILAVEFVHTSQIVMDLLHRKTQGNPSGNPLTVVLNTIVGELYLMLAFLELSRQEKRLDLTASDFSRLVAALIYGDDNIYAIDESIIEWYNPTTLASFFARHGIEYTTADKSGAEQSIKKVSDLRFLKRGFRPDSVYPNYIHAPIDTDTIYEMFNWIRECPNEEEQLYVQIETALREARAHGVEFFSSLRRQVNDALQKVNLPPVGDNFDRYREAWLSQFHG